VVLTTKAAKGRKTDHEGMRMRMKAGVATVVLALAGIVGHDASTTAQSRAAATPTVQVYQAPT
jgi:hypothetical protein